MYAPDKYVQVAGDQEMLHTIGAEMLAETARLWADLGSFRDKGLRFPLEIRGERLTVDITHDEVAYDLADGDPLTIVHQGEQVKLPAGTTTVCPCDASRTPAATATHGAGDASA